MLAVSVILLGPTMIRSDLRHDMAHLAVLKTWPVSGAALVRGEVLAPAVLLSLLATALLVCGAALSGGTLYEVIVWSGATRASFAVAAIVCRPGDHHDASPAPQRGRGDLSRMGADRPCGVRRGNDGSEHAGDGRNRDRPHPGYRAGRAGSGRRGRDHRSGCRPRPDRHFPPPCFQLLCCASAWLQPLGWAASSTGRTSRRLRTFTDVDTERLSVLALGSWLVFRSSLSVVVSRSSLLVRGCEFDTVQKRTQGTKNEERRNQETKNREPRTENREPRTENQYRSR